MAKVQAQEPFKIHHGDKVLAVLGVEPRKTQAGAPSINVSFVVVEDRATSVPQGTRGNAGMLVFENYMLSGRALFKLEQLFGAAKLPSGKDTDDADFADWLRDRITADGIYLLAEVGEEAKWNDPSKKVAKIQRLRGLAFPEFTPEQALAWQRACDKAREADAANPALPTEPKAVTEARAKKWPEIVNKALEKMEQRAQKGGGGTSGASYSQASGSGASRPDDPMSESGGHVNDDEIPFSQPVQG